jgi:hypothetical protein
MMNFKSLARYKRGSCSHVRFLVLLIIFHKKATFVENIQHLPREAKNVSIKNEEMAAPVLSNMQKELLKLYSTEIPDTQLREIKLLLSNYFAQKASSEMDRLWAENNWDDQTMNRWANEHNRSTSSH